MPTIRMPKKYILFCLLEEIAYATAVCLACARYNVDPHSGLAAIIAALVALSLANVIIYAICGDAWHPACKRRRALIYVGVIMLAALDLLFLMGFAVVSLLTGWTLDLRSLPILAGIAALGTGVAGLAALIFLRDDVPESS